METEDAPGNFGLWDQTMAMTWVKENIANFGGDTSKTTLMGHGAGGASASMHMVAKPSKGFYAFSYQAAIKHAPCHVSKKLIQLK